MTPLAINGKFPSLVRRFQNIVTALVLVLSIGLHWPLLQSVAWVNMVIAYSQEDGVEQAIVKTFSGEHPCGLCKVVEAGKETESKQTKEAITKKIDLFAQGSSLQLFAPLIEESSSDFSFILNDRSYPPLAPPPDFHC